MSKPLLRALPDLIQAGIIDEATADRIRSYYEQQTGASGNRLFIVFGILGALLVGMGIVLILAHNWDDLSVPVKLVIGMIPLLATQFITGRLVLKRIDSRTWKEGTATFLFCAIGVSISIVSQVYNIEGDLAGFLLTWICLAVPIVYVLNSGMVAMLCIAGITWYGCEVSYFSYLGSDPASMYWVVIAAILPHYYFTYVRPQVKNNFFVLISWLLVLSLTICLGTVSENTGRLFLLAYISMFSAFVVAGESTVFETGRVLSNSYLVVGSLGVVTILLIASFVDFWEWQSTPDGTAYSPLGMTLIALSFLIAAWALWMQSRSGGWRAVNTKAFAFLLFIAVYFPGVQWPEIGTVIINIGILVLAIYTIRSGARQNHLGILNYGLMIITALIICRFFDTDLGFVVRGILFIAVGVGFFLTNYYMIRKRKTRP